MKVFKVFNAKDNAWLGRTLVSNPLGWLNDFDKATIYESMSAARGAASAFTNPKNWPNGRQIPSMEDVKIIEYSMVEFRAHELKPLKCNKL